MKNSREGIFLFPFSTFVDMDLLYFMLKPSTHACLQFRNAI